METPKKQQPRLHEGDSAVRKPSSKIGSNCAIKYITLVTLTVQSAVAVLSMRYSRTRPGPIFIASTGVLNIEILKLVTSLVLVYQDAGSISKLVSSLKSSIINQPIDTLKVCVPSLIYVIQNNLLYVAVTHLDATTYQISYQLKIATTAMFSTIILHKKLSRIQWISLAILLVGVVLVQHSQPNSNYSEQPGRTASGTGINEKNIACGLAAVIGASFLSGFSGVYFEKIVKGSSVTLWIRNVQLALCSIPFAFVTCVYNDRKALVKKGYFYGYDWFVVYLIILQTVGGFVVAMAVKYADNILKGFATSLAIILSCLMTTLVFDFHLTTQVAVGGCLVIGSVILYGYQEQERQRPHILNPDSLQANSFRSDGYCRTKSLFGSYCSSMATWIKRNVEMMDSICFKPISSVNLFLGLFLITIATVALAPTLLVFILNALKVKN